jgi:hypothetical protein
LVGPVIIDALVEKSQHARDKSNSLL